MPEKKYGYTDDHLIRTVARRNQNGDQFATTGWRWLGTKSTSQGGTSITPKDDPEYVTDYRIAVYHILKEQHGIDVTDLPKGAKNWIDNKIREFRGIYRKIDPERDLDPPSGRSPFWKRYDPEEVADNIVEEMDS